MQTTSYTYNYTVIERENEFHTRNFILDFEHFRLALYFNLRADGWTMKIQKMSDLANYKYNQ